jgi:FdhD protein
MQDMQATSATNDTLSPQITCERYADGEWQSASMPVPVEMDLTVYVNEQELVTLLCTPVKLNCLVPGFLYSEGIISGMGDILSMRVCEDDSLADVRLVNAGFRPPEHRKMTSGCGGGSSFTEKGTPVNSDISVTPAEVLSLMRQFQSKMVLYKGAGGVHGSALAEPGEILMVAEDIGRHNTLDKIVGECLLRRIQTKDRILLSTGRVSSEMLLKASRMQVPLVVSRTSPTERAVTLARDLGIALIGYARGGRLVAYTHPEKLGRAR